MTLHKFSSLEHAEWMQLCEYAYRNYPKFSDRSVWANSADPDRTAPQGAVWSGSSLLAIQYTSFWWNSLRFGVCVWILGRLQQCFLASENLGTLRYATGIFMAVQVTIFSWKNLFSYFFSEHRLRMLVRTPLIYRFKAVVVSVQTFYVVTKIRKLWYIPVNPSFTI